jgi:hypothetical protein
VTDEHRLAISVARLEGKAKLDAILEQTTMTNGRLRKVESWQAWIKGGLAALSLAVPSITGLVVYILTN